MPDIVYRRLCMDDIDTFIQMRIDQLAEEGAKQDCDLRPSLCDYYKKHLADGSFISWIALDGEKIIAASGLSFAEKPPYYGNPTGRYGIISSMYTLPEYRRKGIAKTLLQKIVDEAKAADCGVLWITASDMGVYLYTDFGFVKNGKFMQYKLN